MSNKVKVPEGTKKKMNQEIFGSDYPKVYNSPEDEARIDPEGFFPDELKDGYVVGLIQGQQNKLAEILPKLRQDGNLDEALLSIEMLIKRVQETTYDIYNGENNVIEYLRRAEIIAEKDGKLEINKSTEFLWLLLQVLVLTEGLPGEYTFAILTTVFSGMQVRFPGQKKISRAGLRAQISRILKRDSATTTEELEEQFGLPERELQRLKQEENIWQLKQKKDGKKNRAILTLLLAKKVQKLLKYVSIFKQRYGFQIKKKIEKYQDAKDRLNS